MEVCVLAQDMPDRSKGLLNVAIQHIARHLKQANSSAIACLSF